MQMDCYGQKIATAGEDGRICVWDIITNPTERLSCENSALFSSELRDLGNSGGRGNGAGGGVGGEGGQRGGIIWILNFENS